MTQNNEPKAKPEDAAEPTKPESDQEEIEYLDSDALMAFLDGGEPSPAEPDEDDTDLFKTIELTSEIQEAVASQLEPAPEETDPSPPEPDPAEAEAPQAETDDAEAEQEEIPLFDSSSLLDALEGVGPSEPEPDLEATDPSALEPEPVEAEVSEAEDDEAEDDEDPHDETAFFDSSELLDELEGVLTA